MWMGHVKIIIENIFHSNLCDRSRGNKKISSGQGKGLDTSKQEPSVRKLTRVHRKETRLHQLWWYTPVLPALGAEVER